MEKYVVLDKQIGETPLSCAETWRTENPVYHGMPLAYAGRLDPMASGKLLVLIGDECKRQTEYHGLDKAYDFSVLFGITSDSLDVLGRLETCSTVPVTEEILTATTQKFIGSITLPYPKFSAKTVQGKPLHMWTLENRLDEITIPSIETNIYSLHLTKLETTTKDAVTESALSKINSIPEVTDPRKALGNDFRRTDVRADWKRIQEDTSLPERYVIAHFSCIASSGTYMRTLASEIAKTIDTCGLAFSIHRTHIGIYNQTTMSWTKEY